MGPERTKYVALSGTAPDETWIETFFNFVFACYGNGETLDGVLGPGHDTTVPLISQRGDHPGPTYTGVIHSGTDTLSSFSSSHGWTSLASVNQSTRNSR